MGFLFGSKVAKEEKVFNNALKTAIGSHKEKNLTELLSALNGCPRWQGYWLAGLYYDLGLGKVPVNENKAKEYQLMAENAAKGTPDEEWVDTFYYWYEQNAGNTIRKLDSISLKYRRLGVAALNLYEHGKSYIINDESDDAYTWEKIFPLFGNEEGMNFKYFFEDWAGYEYRDRNDTIKRMNEFTKRAKKDGRELYLKDIKVNASRPEKLSYNDMVVYLLGTTFMIGGPYLLDEVAEGMGRVETHIGIEQLLWAAGMGNVPAIYDLLRYANDDNRKHHDYIAEICQEVLGESLTIKEIDWLVPLVDAGDPEAIRLNNKYGILGDK